MFSIDNTYFLLTAMDPYAQGASERLIVPAIIFSTGAVMLFGHLIIKSIITKKKMKEAEQLKRERIKRFSEEANIRYGSEPEVNLRTKKIVTETPTQGGQNIVNSAMPNMPGMMPNNMNTSSEMQTVLPNAMQQPMPMQSHTANSINANMNNSSNVPSFSAAPQVMPGSNANQLIQPNVQSQPMMNGQVLPGMAAGVIGGSINNASQEEKTNIADLVKKTVAEAEQANRDELQKNHEEEKPKEETKKESGNEQNKIEIEKNDTKNNTSNEETKEENKEKKYKFEYIPEYKPGSEPIKQDKEENKEKIEESKKEISNQDLKNENTNIKEENNEKEKIDDLEVKDNVENEENKKPKRIVIERSPEFASIDAEKEVIETKEEETKEESPAIKRIERRTPVIPKVTSKKIEYNVGYIREVQNKLNASREYDKAISLREKEKEKLKEEFLEKRLKLEELKSELEEKEKTVEAVQLNDTEKIKLDNDNEKEINEEQETKNVKSDEEKILYEEGKKVSLFENVVESSEKKEDTNRESTVDVIDENSQENKNVVLNDEKLENKTREESEEKVENNQEEKENVLLNEDEENKDMSLDEEIKNVSEKSTNEAEGSEVLDKIENLFSSLSSADEFLSEQKEEKKHEHKVEDTKVEKVEDKTLDVDKKEEIKEKTLNEEVKENVQTKDTKLEGTEDKKIQKDKKEIQQEKKKEKNLKQESVQNKPDNNEIEVKKELTKQEVVQSEIPKQRPKMPQVATSVAAATVISNINSDTEGQKNKSILNGVDLEKEILSNKTKTLSTLKEAPNYKKIIVVVSPEKCGKTTVAVNLAYELANRGIKTCLIDTDNVKKDIYYYIHKEHIGCLSRLNEFDNANEMYKLGIDVKENLTVFTENKGIEFEINYSKLYKLIGYAQDVNDAVIIDLKTTLGQEKTKDLLKLATNILFVIDKKVTTLNRVADKFAKIKGGFINKDITLVVNMDEGRSTINKNAIKSIFKHLEYLENGIKKSYTIKTGEIFTVGYDTKAIITGLISQLPAVTVKENKILLDIKKIASHYYSR